MKGGFFVSKRLERKGWNWAPVPAEVILSSKLTHADVRVYAYLLWRAGGKERAWPKSETIAEDLDMSDGAVRISFKHLISENWIRRFRRLAQSSMTYIFETQTECKEFDPSSILLDDVRLTGDTTISQQVRRVNESQKNKSQKNKNKEHGVPSHAPDLLFGAICQVCGIDPTIKGNAPSISKVRSALLSSEPPYTPAEVLAWGKLQAWRHTPPTIWQLQQGIGIVRNWNGLHANDEWSAAGYIDAMKESVE